MGGLAFGFLIVVWTTFAFLVGRFWASRGLEFRWGFFSSFFLSPIAGLVFALNYRSCPVPMAGSAQQGPFCSSCDTKVDASAKRCPKCGCGVFCDTPSA